MTLPRTRDREETKTRDIRVSRAHTFADDVAHPAPRIEKSADVTPAILEDALGLPAGSVAEPVRRMPLSGIGTSCRLYRLSAKRVDGGALPDLILKIGVPAEDATGFWSDRYFRREMEVYRLLAEERSSVAPACYLAGGGEAGDPVYYLLLEDCAVAAQPQFTLDESWGRDALETLVTAMASLHESGLRDTIDPSGSRDWRPLLELDDADCLSRFVRRFADRLTPLERELCALVAAHAPHLRSLVRAPTALIHGDLHPLNIFFAADQSSVKFIDWQFAGWGAGAADLADVLQLYTPAIDRRVLGRDLARLYHRSVPLHRERNYTFDDLWHDLGIFGLLNVLKLPRLASNPLLPAGTVLRLFKRACLCVADRHRDWPLLDDQIRRLLDDPR